MEATMMLGLVVRVACALIVVMALWTTGTSARQGPWRIGWLDPAWTPTERPNDNLTTFQKALADLGYMEGRDFVIETRFADTHYERLPSLAQELVDHGVDVIVTIGTPPVAAAKAATSTIPIVMAGSTDPVGRGLITSLAHPGGNITGVTNNPGPEFNGKCLQLLKEVAPNTSRVVFIWDSLGPTEPLLGAPRELKLSLLPHGLREVRSAEDFDALLSVIKAEGADALFVAPDFVVGRYYPAILRFAAANRIPSLFQETGPVMNGGLLFYYTDWLDLRRRAAGFVDKIIKGAKPADLPVEQPTQFKLVINAKTAKALGLTVPLSMLARANEVIE
jgi:putative ABC transport system substrate-binding protein